jgi:hypothetical protein
MDLLQKNNASHDNVPLSFNCFKNPTVFHTIQPFFLHIYDGAKSYCANLNKYFNIQFVIQTYQSP